MKYSLKVIPDWGSSMLFIVWPRGIEGRGILEKAYIDLTAFVPEDIALHILVKSKSIIEGISNVIKRERPGRRVFFHELSSVMDIWIRDWAPVPVRNDKGGASLVKAR